MLISSPFDDRNTTSGGIFRQNHPVSAAAKPCLHLPLVAETIAGDGFGIGLVVEHLDGNIAPVLAIHFKTGRIIVWMVWHADLPGEGVKARGACDRAALPVR